MNPITALGPKFGGLLAIQGVTDVLINGYREAFVDRAGAGLEQVASPFESEAELGRLAQQIIALGGRHLDQANPFADVAIGTESGQTAPGQSVSGSTAASGGLRVHAALASGCNPNTHLSIRVHSNRLFGLEQLADFGMFDLGQLETLRQIVSSRENFLISGATGSGKTTLLRAMLTQCGGERILALEDVAELGLQSANYISLQTRQPNIEGKGEIGLDRLVREALRMRPDRLVVGEVRGAELIVMLQALNTGHRGAAATIHANSFADVMPRVKAIGKSVGFDADSILEQMHSAFTWIIHVANRKVVTIAKIK
jgi:pilus assembly protein CpaF